MTADPTALPPDEAAFHAAWLGRLWPRYRRLFEESPARRRFEWRAALYPLWLGVPGLYVPLVGVTLIVLAACAALASQEADMGASTVVVMAGGLVILWPAAAIGLMIVTDGGLVLPAIGLGMLAVSLGLGTLTPRWIVAEGHRRWSRHAARVAAGQAPALPKAVTAFSPLRLLVLLLVVGVPLLLAPWDAVYREDHLLERAYDAAMKSGLRNLVVAEESFYADSVRYTTDLNALEYEHDVGVRLRIISASDSGWAAIASHDSSETTCAIFVGNAAPPIAGAVEGEPICRKPDR